MIKKFFAAALLITSLVACKSKSAVNFNNKLVLIENSLIVPMQTEEKSATEYFTNGNYDSLYAVGSRLEKLVQSKIDEVEAIKTPDISQAENFKASYIKAFKALKEVYTSFKEVGAAKSDEDRQKIIDGMQALVDEKNDATKDMQAAQRIFASSNGFKVQ